MASPADPGAHNSMKQRDRVYKDDLNSDYNLKAKHPGHALAPQTQATTETDKESFIEDWLDECSCSGKSSTEIEIQVTRLADRSADMSCKPPSVPPSSEKSSESTTSASTNSEKSTASVHDTDYRQSLSFRDIFIERENAPQGLTRRAWNIMTRARQDPDLNDATVQKVIDMSRGLQDAAEAIIMHQLAPIIIPAMFRIPDKRLAMNCGQQWLNSVPVPLRSSVLHDPLPLPQPKPDLVFGYSEAAFTRNQLDTIGLLTDDQSGGNYAAPDQKVRFPFLQVEFKSQAYNGTHYVAKNHAAGAGAIALNGQMDLIHRRCASKTWDCDMPRYFSISMDHRTAAINVHWLKAQAGGGQYSFHTEELSIYSLRDPVRIRSLFRVIKNILDYGAQKRLPSLCSLLDEYRQKVIRGRAAANAQKTQPGK